MSVIGNPLVTTNYISDSFSGDASTVAFTLSQAPASAASIAVYISGLYQIPTSAYTISGTTLTFTGAPPTGTNNITVLHLGVKSATLVPVAGSVTPQMLSNANVVYWSASNNNVGVGNVTPTSLLTVTGTAALGNTTITGFANVTTTLAAGNTIITGTANVTSDVYVGGYLGVNSAPTTGYRVTIDNGGATTGDYSPLVLKGGSSSENGGQLGLWNTHAGVSNPKKWIRIDNSGRLGIINSGYTAQIFSLDDSGNLTVAGTFGSSSKGISKGSLPTGSILQVVTNYPSTGAVYSTSATSYAEISTAYRTSITPISSSSILILEWVGLVGGNFTGAISTMKFYDVTNSADVGLSGISLGSRGIGHASFRQVDGDVNDRDNIILRAVVPSSSTAARTYSIYHYSENTTTKYFNATATDNGGCSYVKWHFIIKEIVA